MAAADAAAEGWSPVFVAGNVSTVKNFTGPGPPPAWRCRNHAWHGTTVFAMKAHDEKGFGNAGVIALSRLPGTGGTRHYCLTARHQYQETAAFTAK